MPAPYQPRRPSRITLRALLGLAPRRLHAQRPIHITLPPRRTVPDGLPAWEEWRVVFVLGTGAVAVIRAKHRRRRQEQDDLARVRDRSVGQTLTGRPNVRRTWMDPRPGRTWGGSFYDWDSGPDVGG